MLKNSCVLIEDAKIEPYFPCKDIVLGGLQQVH